MEKIKSLIPNDLKRMVAESTEEKLTHSCSSLLEFLLPLPEFQRVIGDLTSREMGLCRKNKHLALDSKNKGNECFSKGDYAKALSLYSQALRYVPMSANDMDNSLVATLYVNRASALHKLGLLEECVRDCSRAIALSPAYAKAWYRRGKANASLKNYEVAIHDLEISLSMEGSLSGKSQIKEEVNMILSLFSGAHGGTYSCVNGKHTNLADLDGPHDILLQCVTMPLKGRGMVSLNDIPPASLIHSEEPLSAIVMKACRESHCHFCFNEVPADVLFCSSCTIPIYCSHYCQEQAGVEQFVWNQKIDYVQKNLSADLQKHVMDTILASHGKQEVTDATSRRIPEHRHECGGAPWPAVLPPDIVLASRVMANSIEERKLSGDIFKPAGTLEFVHNYHQIPSNSKLGLHIYSIVLSYCLHHYYGLDFPFNGASASQLVLLISQIKVNSMAVVHMKTIDEFGAFEKLRSLSASENPLTCTEQVRVGQAIFATGSLFNHSCQPNIHAYFLSRRLIIRSTEFVPAWYPLEMSYGPQVGQLSLQERQALLEEQYSFNCQCTGCSKLSFSDLVIDAFRCLDLNCLGAVSEKAHHKKLADNYLQISGASYSFRLSLPVSQQEKDVGKVACMLLNDPRTLREFGPGSCLSCGSYIDLESGISNSESAMMDIERLKYSIDSNEAPGLLTSNALQSLSRLRSVRHPYSKIVAQAEDIIAEYFVSIGEFGCAIPHCKASIEILEKLYHPNHIVVGHELMKLTSIQLITGDRSSVLRNIERLEAIFSLYYGSHAAIIFPYLSHLSKEVGSLA